MGIEPTSEAWEAYLKARKRTNWRHFLRFSYSSNGFQLEQRQTVPLIPDRLNSQIPFRLYIQHGAVHSFDCQGLEFVRERPTCTRLLVA